MKAHGPLLALVCMAAAACAPTTRRAPGSATPAEVTALSESALPHAIGFPSARKLATAPPGRSWSNIAAPLDPKWGLLLHPDAREAWGAYVTLPLGERDVRAFASTLARTEALCQTATQCTAESRVRAGYALQGWYEGASLLEWYGELWASPRNAGETCAARIAELRRDSALAPVISGAHCGPVLEADASETPGASWHRFEKGN